MGCCTSGNNRTVETALIFKRDHLLYDISNYAYIEGHIMVTDDVHQRHTVQDVSEEGNIDRVNHVLDIVYAATVEMLYPYTKEKPLEDEIFCEHACRHEYFVITMQVPETISRTTLHLLQKLIHEYMVCKTVADWMSITNPAKAQTWETKAKGAEREIRSCLNARMTRVRRRCHPF